MKRDEQKFIKRHNLQGCENCERYADLDLMHSVDDYYVCELCYDPLTITQN